MNFRPRDLIQLKKDIARVRKHEEERRSRTATPESQETAFAPPQSPTSQKESVPMVVRIRKLLQELLDRPPSKESLEAIPEYLITVLQVIREEPKFRAWLLRLQDFPLSYRNQQLGQMARAFRIEDGNSIVAATFDRLCEPALFNAVCRFFCDKDTYEV